MTKNNPEKLKFFLYAVIVLIFITITAVFINYRYSGAVGEYLTGSVGKPTLSLDKVRHVATKDGVNQWSLKAVTVNYYQGKNSAVFEDLTVFLFSENNEETTLTARTGQFNTETNDIIATGDVEVVNGTYILKSEELHYSDSKRVVRSFVPVKILNEGSVLTADKMESNLDSGITILEGNVTGVLRGDFGKRKAQ